MAADRGSCRPRLVTPPLDLPDRAAPAPAPALIHERLIHEHLKKSTSTSFANFFKKYLRKFATTP